MIEIERKHLGVMMEAGYILLGMQRYKEAREVFEGVLAIVPGSEAPLVAIGSVDFCQGKFAQAIKSYKQALDNDAESVYAMAYMGEALFFSGKKKEAIVALKKVSKIDLSGKAGDFARALLDAIDKGFDPDMLSGHKEMKEYEEKKKRSHTRH